MQSGQGSDSGMECRHAVDDWDTGEDGRVALFSGNHGYSGHGLTDGVITDVLAVRAELSEGGHVDHNHPGVQLFENVIAESHILDGAGPEILHQYVGHFNQVAQNLFRFVLAHVDAEALLSGVVLYPIGALLSHPRSVVPGLFATQPLNFDNFCAHPG